MRTPFDLTRFMAGEPAVTDTGLDARFERHIPDAQATDRLVFSVVLPKRGRVVFTCDEQGRNALETAKPCGLDLYMAPRVAIAA